MGTVTKTKFRLVCTCPRDTLCFCFRGGAEECPYSMSMLKQGWTRVGSTRGSGGQNILNALCEVCSFYDGVFDRNCNEKVLHYHISQTVSHFK